MHEDETRTTECAFSIMPRPHARKRTFVTSSAKFQIARHAPGARAPGAHCPYGTDVRRCRQTSRASPGNARAHSYIAGKFLARFVFKKDFFILSCLWKWLDSAFQTCLPLSKIQRDARRALPPHVFRRFSRRSGAPGRRQADRALRRSRSPGKIQNRALRAFFAARTPHFPQGYHGEHSR